MRVYFCAGLHVTGVVHSVNLRSLLVEKALVIICAFHVVPGSLKFLCLLHVFDLLLIRRRYCLKGGFTDSNYQTGQVKRPEERLFFTL